MTTSVCMVTTSYPKFTNDTTAPFIAALAEGVAQNGWSVDVVLPHHAELVAGERHGVNLYPYHYAPVAALNRWGYAESMAGDVKLRRAAYLTAPLAMAATLAMAMRVAQRRRSAVIHAHWVIPNGPPAALVAAARRSPLVVSLHGSDVTVAERPGPMRAAAGWVLRSASAVIACSPDLAERALRLGAAPATTCTIPYGVDTDQFRPDPAARARLRQHLGIDDDSLLLLGLGRLVYKKGFSVAIEAMARAARANLILAIAGDGDLRVELEAQARSAGVAQQVRFLGHSARSEVPALFAAADLFLLPSIHDQSGNVDGLPNVLLEAMATGCAVIASDLAGVRLVIDDYREGVILPEGDAPALAQAIGSLADDRDLRLRLGAAARRRMETNQTWRQAVNKLLAVYRRVDTAVTTGDGRQGDHDRG